MRQYNKSLLCPRCLKEYRLELAEGAVPEWAKPFLDQGWAWSPANGGIYKYSKDASFDIDDAGGLTVFPFAEYCGSEIWLPSVEAAVRVAELIIAEQGPSQEGRK